MSGFGLVGAGHALAVNPDQAQCPKVSFFQQLGDSFDVAGAVCIIHVLTPSRALAAVADLGGSLPLFIHGMDSDKGVQSIKSSFLVSSFFSLKTLKSLIA